MKRLERKERYCASLLSWGMVLETKWEDGGWLTYDLAVRYPASGESVLVEVVVGVRRRAEGDGYPGHDRESDAGDGDVYSELDRRPPRRGALLGCFCEHRRDVDRHVDETHSGPKSTLHRRTRETHKEAVCHVSFCRSTTTPPHSLIDRSAR